jgi:hypothetical protein
MIDCPECWHQFHSGNSCPACGHVIHRPAVPVEKRDEKISDAQSHADAWLVRQGIVTEDMTAEERKQAVTEYRKSIMKKPKAPPSRAWAREILERENVDYLQEKFAVEALAEVIPNEDL